MSDVIDMSTMEFGEEPNTMEDYVIQITGVYPKKSDNTGSFYISFSGIIANGPSTGFPVRPPMVMLFHPGKLEKTKQYMIEASQKFARILGIAPTAVVLPRKPGVRTETLDALLNARYLAKVKYVPEKTDEKTGRVYQGYWEPLSPIKPIFEEDVIGQGDGEDYAAFFIDE